MFNNKYSNISTTKYSTIEFNPFSPSVFYKGRQFLLPFFYTESHYF